MTLPSEVLASFAVYAALRGEVVVAARCRLLASASMASVDPPRSFLSAHRRALLAIVLAIVAACASPPPEDPEQPADGGGVAPAASAERSHDLVFVSERSGSAQLYRLDLDSRETMQLTFESGGAAAPRWVELLGAVVFAGGGEAVEPELDALVPDGTAPAFLMPNPAGAGGEVPDWSDGGRKMLFSAFEGGQRELFVANAEGERLARLTDHPANDRQPRLSPDGTRVAFISDRDGDDDLFVLELGSGTVTNLTASPGRESAPEWSPDGSSLLFLRSEKGGQELYLLALPGGAPMALAPELEGARAGRFSPDGEWIAFAARADGDVELFRIRPDGSGVERLTARPGLDHQPVWVPRRVFGDGESDG